jgi:5-oxoprolinase (ATP-hydrolysing)
MRPGEPRWRVGVDVGGTFADCVAVARTGEMRRIKLLASGVRRLRVRAAESHAQVLFAEGLPAWCLPALRGSRARLPDGASEARVAEARVVGDSLTRLALDRPLGATECVELGTDEPAPVWGARLLTGTPLGEPLPLEALHLSTTRGTNALLEGGRAPVALVCNEGLEGVIRIGSQQRSGLFDLVARVPDPLVGVVRGISARMAVDGTALHPVEPRAVAALARELRAAGVAHVAVALIHSWRSAAQEDAVARILRAEGVPFVVTSAELASVPRLEPRARTAVVEARLHEPVLRYLDGVARGIGSAPLLVGTSTGAAAHHAAFRAKDSLLSGPAAGCRSAAAALARIGGSDAISFDMGGTSTDVARLSPRGVALRMETTVAERAVAAPSVDVHSVAAGGGSICVATPHGLFVGPRSAGADPGPACYGRGGPLTLTDVNLLLGRLWPGTAALPLAIEPARRAAEAESARSGVPMAVMLRGFLEIAHEHMAAAIRTVTTGAGHDPREHALLAFGGAGGQHACAVADRLGMPRVHVPAHAGFQSAEGVLGAEPEADAAAAVMAPLGDGCALDAAIARAAAVARARCASASIGSETRALGVTRIVADLRAPGRGGRIALDASPESTAHDRAQALRAAFNARLRAMGDPAHALDPEVESVHVWVGASAPPAAVRPSRTPPPRGECHGARGEGAPRAEPIGATVHGIGQDGIPCPVWDWRDVPGTAAVPGPALIVGDGATVVVEPEWVATPDADGGLVLERRPSGARTTPMNASPIPARGATRATVAPDRAGHDAVGLEVAAARFVAIGAWMGTCLERSAQSVNVKERLDFSCGILNPRGELVANAPHIPVHLGALGACARAMLARVSLGPGDAALTNDPRHGGSHLPDLTLLRPVHARDGAHLGFVAARAHHAEIGGAVPGSMPPQARTLAEEGVLVPPTVVMRDGVLDEALLRRLLASGPWPSRLPDLNIADIRAGLAALDAGVAALRALADEQGTDTLLRAMDRLMERSAAHVRALAAGLPRDRPLAAEVTLDDGWRIAARVERVGADRLRVRLDTDGVHPGNFNAPLAVTRSALLYVLRVLAGHASPEGLDDHRAPLNEGFLAPVDLEVSPGLLNPFDDPACDARAATDLPAVFAGNTETSQRLVEALLGAFVVVAASQGTMNNLVLGNAGFSMYETMGGGAGAAARLQGASAVHVHMSNTRLTDPETLEIRHPVRVEVLRVREGSGGAGRWPGGCGMVRRLRMLEPAHVCFVGQHRTAGPPGCAGGAPGAPGIQRILRADGLVETMPGVFEATLAAGDAVEVETPGGGGYGPANPPGPPAPPGAPGA